MGCKYNNWWRRAFGIGCGGAIEGNSDCLDEDSAEQFCGIYEKRKGGRRMLVGDYFIYGNSIDGVDNVDFDLHGGGSERRGKDCVASSDLVLDMACIMGDVATPFIPL